MTRHHVTEHDMFMLIFKGGAWLVIGELIGLFHYMTLRWNVEMLATRSSVPLAMAVQVIRLVLMATALTVISRHYGAMPLLVAGFGVVASRAAVLRLGALS
jgi:F1F0 ATPase subunit 2